ncbi:MAG: ABC-F family ATP-binding cassette domain-containing protein [Planctomycetota bacterium]|jgi:ATP-binding cassette subfamily F protein 3|nr:ABC-F family ATP-binding cassette domain-containing protein [Planctomycetota bacterium]
MPVLLRVQDAHKAYADQVLLDGAELTITDAMKVGVVGRNGAGKSTLCQAILGRLELDSGVVDVLPDTRIAYLEQHDPFDVTETVLGFLERYTGASDWRCGAVAGRFDIKGAMLEAPIGSLSGGWQTRVKLSAMLLQDPDLLILDEPTNFLDLRTQLLLERFLAEWRGGALIVSHDRSFLRNTCTHTCEVAHGKLSLEACTVDAYYERLAERRVQAEKTNAAMAARRKQLQIFIDKHRANANTASQARNKTKQLERLEDEELAPLPGPAPRIVAPQVIVRDGTACRCLNLAIGYGDTVIARCEGIELERGSKIVVLGDNGQGKTTFVRTLTGSLDAIEGSANWTHGADIGIYGQHVFGTLPDSATVLEYLQTRSPDGTREQEILAMAGSFLFRDDAVHKPINVLSGGERARMVLAGMLLHRHTVLVLDEPTNHLDGETVSALADALSGYAGTVILVSHDREFIERIATVVIEVRDGTVTSYPGDFATWLYRVKQEIAAGDRKGGDTSADKPGSESNAAPGERKQRAKLERELSKRCASLERKVGKLETDIATCDQALAACTNSVEATRLHGQAQELRTKLEVAEHDWLVAQEDLEALN